MLTDLYSGFSLCFNHFCLPLNQSGMRKAWPNNEIAISSPYVKLEKQKYLMSDYFKNEVTLNFWSNQLMLWLREQCT